MTTGERVALVLFAVALFVAVAVGTYAVLDLLYPPPPAVQLEVLCAPQPVMPEDLDRPGRECR